MTLHAELDRYLNLRRMFGAKLKADELRLRSFATFVDKAGKEFVTKELLLEWMDGLRPASSGTKASRFSAVRQFALWLHGMDDRHDDPPPRGFVPRTSQSVRAVHLQRYRTRPDHRGGAGIAVDIRAARTDLRDALWSDHCHGHARCRGLGARHGQTSIPRGSCST